MSVKLIEAVLYALAALAKDNSLVANHLDKPFQDGIVFQIYAINPL